MGGKGRKGEDREVTEDKLGGMGMNLPTIASLGTAGHAGSPRLADVVVHLLLLELVQRGRVGGRELPVQQFQVLRHVRRGLGARYDNACGTEFSQLPCHCNLPCGMIHLWEERVFVGECVVWEKDQGAGTD